MGSAVIGLVCSRCGRTFDHLAEHHVCSCGGPLLVEVDLDRVRRATSPGDIAQRRGGMWRWWELLPVEDRDRIVSLGEGATPLREAPELAAALGVAAVFVKDEGANPTGMFKARGA